MSDEHMVGIHCVNLLADQAWHFSEGEDKNNTGARTTTR